MKKKNIKEELTVKELEELASILSGEKGEEIVIPDQYMTYDIKKTESQWNELKNIHDNKSIDVEKAWNNVSSKIKNYHADKEAEPLIRQMKYHLLRIAAAVIILLGFSALTIYLNKSDFLVKKIISETTRDQSNLKISLPDGSNIFLNRNSKLSYRKNFGKTSREVILTGEAFFDISANPEIPFAIDAGTVRIEVVGTSFNVITENEKAEVEVYVKTGKVALSDRSGEQKLFLDPGYIGRMNSKTAGKAINSNPNYLSWNTGILEYKGQKLEVVFRDLKKVYNMEIVADDPSILENRWTSMIDYQPGERIILLICTSFNLSYKKDGDVYHLSKK